MATKLSFLLPTADSHHTSHFKFRINPNLKFQSFSFSLSKFNRWIVNSPPPSFSTSHSPDPPSPPSSPSIAYNTLNPPRTGRFLTNGELQRLQFLDNFTYSCKLPSGYLSVRVMKDFELDMTVGLLAESFAESMFLPNMYLTVLGFLIKQYLIERRGLMPHAVTLIGFYRWEGDGEERKEEEEELAGTVEVSFDKRGANASPPTPTPPKNCPYICNMTVEKSLRRRGIGWHLLKASEELISNMGCSRNVYLHCRMIDSAPFSMYKKAGYNVVKTDSFLILLTLQRRKHLMCKELPAVSKPTEIIIVRDEEEAAFSETDRRESEALLPDEVPVLHIFVYEEPMLSVSTIPDQGYQIWVVQPAQDVNLYPKFTLTFSFFKWWQLHFLDCHCLSGSNSSIIQYVEIQWIPMLHGDGYGYSNRDEEGDGIVEMSPSIQTVTFRGQETTV